MCFYVRANKCGPEEYELMSCRCGWSNHVNISDWHVLKNAFSHHLQLAHFIYTREEEKKRNIKPLSGLQDCRALFWANKCCGSNPAALLIYSSIRGQRSFLCGAFCASIIHTSVLWRNLLCYVGMIVEMRKWCRTCSWWRDSARNIRPTKWC